MRHSFISMFVAKFRSIGEAAIQAGNSEGIIRRHYLDLRARKRRRITGASSQNARLRRPLRWRFCRLRHSSVRGRPSLQRELTGNQWHGNDASPKMTSSPIIDSSSRTSSACATARFSRKTKNRRSGRRELSGDRLTRCRVTLSYGSPAELGGVRIDGSLSFGKNLAVAQADDVRELESMMGEMSFG